MAKILIITDDPNATTGNGKVCRYTCKGLEKHGHQITSIVAWNGLGGNNKYHYKLWPIDPSRQVHEDTFIKVMMACHNEDPDIIFVHGDIWNFHYIGRLKTRAKKIGYITVDFEPISQKHADIYKMFDVILTPSTFAAKVIDQYTGVNVSVLHEGVDTDIFKPINKNERTQIRKALTANCAKESLNQPTFYVSMLSRPIARKNLPAGIEAISLLPEYLKSKVGLICMYDAFSCKKIDSEHDMDSFHATMLPPKMPKITVPQVGPLSLSCGDDKIALNLGVSDVMLMPTQGEGFGLPVLEAMAVGCIPIVTNCTSMPDLVTKDRGYLVDVGAWIYNTSNEFKNSKHAMVSAKHMSECIESVMKSKDNVIDNMRSNCVKFAKSMTWDIYSDKLNKIINEVMANSYNTIRIEEV